MKNRILLTLCAMCALTAFSAAPALANHDTEAKTLSVSRSGGGAVTGGGIDCGSTCSVQDQPGESCTYVGNGNGSDGPNNRLECTAVYNDVTLTAHNQNGWAHTGWGGACSGTASACTVTMNSDRNVSATFADIDPPQVGISGPDAGTSSGAFPITATASDNDAVARVEFFVRGVAVDTDTSAPFGTSFDSTTVADGAAELKALAYDPAGLATATTRTVTIDNDKPTLGFTGGPNGQTFGLGTTHTWSFAAADAGAGVQSVECKLDGAGFGACSGGSVRRCGRRSARGRRRRPGPGRRRTDRSRRPRTRRSPARSPTRHATPRPSGAERAGGQRGRVARRRGGRGPLRSAPAVAQLYLQRDQPPGVPPLQLTGERTLPDVPEENYWYRRHLVVYEWIASRVGGRRVVDLACGEGYGSAVLARTAASVVGVDANPEAFEHARLRYRAPKLRFERTMLELWEGDVDCVVFLQTIEHVQDPDAVLARLRALVGSDGVAYVSTPNVLTLAPKGEARSGNPWHVREYRAEEYRALCERHFGSVELLGLFHARKLRAHQVAIERLGWDRVHRALRITKPFYDRFTPAISVRDFALRAGDLDHALDFVAVLRP